MLLAGAAALILARGFGVKLPGVPVLWLTMAVAALVLIIIRWATLPKPDSALLAALISIAGAVLRVLAGARETTAPTEQLG